MMLETSEHHIGSLPAIALTYPPEEVYNNTDKRL